MRCNHGPRRRCWQGEEGGKGEDSYRLRRQEQEKQALGTAAGVQGEGIEGFSRWKKAKEVKMEEEGEGLRVVEAESGKSGM